MSNRGKRKGAEQRYNLKMMRKHTPAPDLLNIGEKPNARPAYNPNMKSSHVHYKLFPNTLDELMERLGEHGLAAGMDILWSAVSRWLMAIYDYDTLSNPYSVASLSVMLCRAHDRKRLGFPAYASKRVTLVLDDLSEDNRQEALRVAAETIVDCQRAGKLTVAEDSLKSTFQCATVIIASLAEALALTTKDNAACPL